MRTSTSRWSGAIVMSPTRPTPTPRKVTGAPTSRPCTDSLKYVKNATVTRRVCVAPRPTASASAAAKPEDDEEADLHVVGGGRHGRSFPLRRGIEELTDARVVAVAQDARVADREDALALLVEQEAAVGDAKDAPDLVGHHQHRQVRWSARASR